MSLNQHTEFSSEIPGTGPQNGDITHNIQYGKYA